MLQLLFTPHEERQRKVHQMMRGLLESQYQHINISDLKLEEDTTNEESSVSFKLQIGEEKIKRLSGAGYGVVDSIFGAIMTATSTRFKSLKNIKLKHFSIEAKFNAKKDNQAGSNAMGEVALVVSNSHFGEFVFRCQSRSINSGIVFAIEEMFQYFINSEKCAILLRDIIEDAKKRNRNDIMEKSIKQLTELIKNAPCEEAFKNENR